MIFMRLFTLAIFSLFTAFCVIVAIANRTPVTFSLHPLPFAWELPIYLLLFLGIFIGLGAGAMVVIWKSFHHARHNRRQARKIRDLEEALAARRAREPNSPGDSA